MMKIWMFLAIAVVPFVVGRSLRDPYHLNEGHHAFTISMLKSLEKSYPGQNHIFSPHSTGRVLLQTYLSMYLSNETMDSLKSGMFLDWASDEDDVARAFVAESTARSYRTLGDSVEFESVDKLYTSDGISLKPRATELFSNSIQKVDFTYAEARREEINAWVEEITRNHIKDLIPQGAIKPETVLVLANAAYFKGLWANKFNKQDTKTETFNGATPADVEMMTVEAKFNYGKLAEEKAAYLEMPYISDDKSLSMLVFLPNENSPTAVDNLLSKMSAKTIRKALEGNYPTKVNVKFPKMNLDGKYELPATFKDMGFKRLPFENVFHKAKIEVDEEGSVAAAATAAVVTRGFQMPEEFHCDHPFVFMINDRVTHEVLFAGVYRGPAKE